MNKKIFLTSALCMVFACPAFAVNNDEWIETGDTCDNTNLGTYEGTANVEAIWTLDPRTCSAGQSYDSTTNTCITCTAGNYCPGGTFNVTSQTNGLNACPNGYALSADGAGADTDCYRQCATSDVAHSTGVSGGYYYGDNNQCSAESCANGWHLKSTGVNLAQYSNTSPTTSSSGLAYWISNSGSAGSNGGSHNAAYYGLTENNTWASDLGYYQVRGEARCSTVQGDSSNNWANAVVNGEIVDETGTEGARYCYCHISGARADDSSAWQSASSAWVFYSDLYSADDCANACVRHCAAHLGFYAGLRGALFNSVAPGLATCEANNIALKWYNDNTEVVPANSAAEQCTYNETITVPTNEPSKTGYTFGGWKLKTTTQD